MPLVGLCIVEYYYDAWTHERETLSTLNTELYYSILNTIMTSINLCPNMLYFNFPLLFCKLCVNFFYPRCTVLHLQIQLKMLAETYVGPHVKCQYCPLLTTLVVCWRILVGISSMENVTNICSLLLKLFPAYAIDRWIINSHLHDANPTVGDGRPILFCVC